MSDQNSKSLTGMFAKQIAVGLLLISGLFVTYFIATYLMAVTGYSIDPSRVVLGLMKQAIILGLVSGVLIWSWPIIKFLTLNINVFGTTNEQRIFGFLIASIFKPAAVWAILTLPVIFVNNAFQDAADLSVLVQPTTAPYINQAADLSNTISDSVKPSEMTGAVYIFVNALQIVVSALIKILSEFDYNNAATFFLVWLIVSRIIPNKNEIALDGNASIPGGQVRQLGVLIFIGIYLAIIAMISLPWFNVEPVTDSSKYEMFFSDIEKVRGTQHETTKVSNTTSSELDSQLEASIDIPNLKNKVKDWVKNNSLSEKDFSSIKGAERIANQVATIWNKRLDLFAKRTEDILNKQSSVKHKLSRNKNGIDAQIEDIKNKILSHYRISVQQVRRERDRVRFYQESLGWYEDSVAQLQTNMRRCENLAISDSERLNSYVASMENLIDSEKERLRSNYDYFTQKNQPSSASTGQNLTDLNVQLAASSIINDFQFSFYDRDENFDSSVQCEIFGNYDALPQPLKPGESWGIFGSMSAWLLEAETIEMCLLTGMIGFGLLGASLSYMFFSIDLVEEKFRNGFTPSIIVTLRGTTAAVATYLLLRGGVNMITDAGANVSPYILFAVCFVAAIYSEEAWDKIHKWFGKATDEIGR